MVVDDQPLIRDVVHRHLEESGFVVCAEAHDADGAIDATVRERPDICLLDLGLPGSGLRAAREIGRVCPETAVVILTASDEDRDLFDALAAGAAGYLTKDMDLNRLPEALRGVLHGQAAMPRHLVARVLPVIRDLSRAGRIIVHGHRVVVALTPREAEVAGLLLEQLDTAEMAMRLFVAQVTVRSHLGTLMHKFGVHDRAALVEALGGG